MAPALERPSRAEIIHTHPNISEQLLATRPRKSRSAILASLAVVRKLPNIYPTHAGKFPDLGQLWATHGGSTPILVTLGPTWVNIDPFGTNLGLVGNFPATFGQLLGRRQLRKELIRSPGVTLLDACQELAPQCSASPGRAAVTRLVAVGVVFGRVLSDSSTELV